MTQSIQQQINTLNAEVAVINGNIATLNSEVSTINSSITTLQSTVAAITHYSQRVSQLSVIPGAGSVNLSLNQIPVSFRVALQCLTAELNYNVGDRVILNPQTISLSADTTYLYFIKPASFVIPYKDGSNSPTAINTANWYLEIVSFYVS